MTSPLERLAGTGGPLKREPPKVWRVLAKAHDARNLAEYRGDLTLDERLLVDMLAACNVVVAKLKALPPLP